MIRSRDKNGKRVETRINDIYPYCFVRDADALKIPCLQREKGHVGLYGESLTKIICSEPSELHRIKKEYDTWESNVPFVNRVLIDSGFNTPEYEHRIWFIDGEWKIGSGEITILSALDSFTGKMFVWFTHPDYPAGKYNEIPCFNHPEGKEVIKLDTPAIAFANEKSLLSSFTNHLAKHDPDIITGWNVVNADVQQIITRMKANELNPASLSPMRRIRYEYRDWSQPIAGRMCIDLMVAFTRLWVLKNGQLPSRKLDDVAWECLRERKLELKDGHDTYYSDLGTYLDYNIRDVTLLPELNALNNAIEHHLAIQNVVGCDIKTTPFVTKLFTVLALRDTEFDRRIPTKPQFEHEVYEGADIMDIEPSVFDNVGILDVKAMYHANISLHNISWETLSSKGIDCGNGSSFLQGERGLLGRQMGLLTDLRDDYKRSFKGADNESDRKKYDALQYATKSLIASMYGVAGDSRYGMYHPKIAAAVTFTSRQTLNRLREECLSHGYTVHYGHTDSVMVEVPSPEEGVRLVADINTLLSPIVVEFERWCKRFLITAKNRYAACVTWSEGQYHEPNIYFKGIELKQSRMPQSMKDTMTNVIEGILTNKTEGEITEYIVGLVSRIVAGEVPIDDLLMKGELKRDLSKYKSIGEARAGAAWANDKLGKGYRAGSFFKVTLDDRGNYIAFDDPAEIQGIANIGYQHIAERFIVNKIKQYYALAGWDFQPVLNALHGKALVEWV